MTDQSAPTQNGTQSPASALAQQADKQPEKTAEQVIKEHELRFKQADEDVNRAKEDLHQKTQIALSALRDYSNIKEQYLLATVQLLQQRLQKLQLEQEPKREDNVAT